MSDGYLATACRSSALAASISFGRLITKEKRAQPVALEIAADKFLFTVCAFRIDARRVED